MKILPIILLFGSLSSAFSALKPGDSLQTYEVKNSRNGDEFCPVCAYSNKTAKVAAFGKLADPKFWADLEQLQTFSTKYPKLGVFAQVIDTADAAAVKAEALKHGIKFPVVLAVEKDWDKIYQVNGVSRTIYYAAKTNEIVWVSVGLDGASAGTLTEKLKVDLAG